jgi:hypothetical protein
MPDLTVTRDTPGPGGSADIEEVVLRHFVDFGLRRSYGGTLEVSHDHYR